MSDLGRWAVYWESYNRWNNRCQQRKKRKVLFANHCSIVLIPTRQEYIEAGCDLWYKFASLTRPGSLPLLLTVQFHVEEDDTADNVIINPRQTLIKQACDKILLGVNGSMPQSLRSGKDGQSLPADHSPDSVDKINSEE